MTPSGTLLREFRAFSMKRSGHHAIMLWIAGHFEEPVRHFNDVHGVLDPTASSGTDPTFNRLLALDDQRSSLPAGSFRSQCTIVSCEDLELPRLPALSGLGGCVPVSGGQIDVRRLLCIRDPYNMLASRFELWPDQVRRSHRQILEQWCGYAEEYLGRTSFIPDRIPVAFNRWFVSRQYREALSRALGLKFTDRGFRVIPAAMIGGSSFDRSEPPLPHPEGMQVLSRWEAFLRSEEFWSFLAAMPDVHQVSAEIFGELPGIRELITS